MNQTKKPKWGNIRSLQSDIDSWINFLKERNLGSLPAFAKKAIVTAIEKEKRKKKHG